jgi:hypothetical protein
VSFDLQKANPFCRIETCDDDARVADGDDDCGSRRESAQFPREPNGLSIT